MFEILEASYCDVTGGYSCFGAYDWVPCLRLHFSINISGNGYGLKRRILGHVKLAPRNSEKVYIIGKKLFIVAKLNFCLQAIADGWGTLEFLDNFTFTRETWKLNASFNYLIG